MSLLGWELSCIPTCGLASCVVVLEIPVVTSPDVFKAFLCISGSHVKPPSLFLLFSFISYCKCEISKKKNKKLQKGNFFCHQGLRAELFRSTEGMAWKGARRANLLEQYFSALGRISFLSPTRFVLLLSLTFTLD